MWCGAYLNIKYSNPKFVNKYWRRFALVHLQKHFIQSKQAPSEESLENRLAAAMIALSELEGDSSELDRVLALSGSQIEKQVKWPSN